MRKSHLQLYAPFIALAVVQALFIVVAPSTAPDQTSAGRFGPGVESGGDFGAGELGDDFEGVGFEGGAGGGAAGSGGAGAAGGGGSGGGTGGGARSGAGGAGGGGAAGGQGGGDTSHCTPDGRQHGITYHAPPCVPKWPEGADNGGATYQGVTADEILVIQFTTAGNEQVNAILAAEGLAATEEESRNMREASLEFLHKHYELYGRRIRLETFEADCPTTPPDPAKCRAAANEVVRKRPFMVVWGTGLYPDVFDVFARNGIISVGGWHFEERYFNDRRPYRWDLNMGGNRTGDVIAEYYCKKLANKNATHSGPVIHAQIGARGAVPRKLGLITPDTDAKVLAARRIAAAVQQCDGNEVPIFTYESDINRAEEQTAATVAGLIEARVTTVACLCDPIAPVFLTNGLTRNRYFPEHLLAGTEFMDFDKVGRLYDPAQWRHAFGISHIGAPIPHEQTDAAKVWRDVGYHEKTGQPVPCQSCNLPWAYFSLMGSFIHNAGPNLNPLTVERGAFEAGPRGGWEETGGRPEIVLTEFGPNDYTAISDVREVYWSPAARSAIDGRPGAYVMTHGGQRWRPGQLPADFTVPAP